MGHKTGVGPRVAEPCAAGEPQDAGSARTSRLQPPRTAPGTATTAPTQPARGKHTEEVTMATGTGSTNKAVPSHGPLVGRQSSTSDSSFHGGRAVPVSLPLGGGGLQGAAPGHRLAHPARGLGSPTSAPRGERAAHGPAPRGLGSLPTGWGMPVRVAAPSQRRNTGRVLRVPVSIAAAASLRPRWPWG